MSNLAMSTPVDMKQQEIDDNEALYIVLRSAEFGCEQKFIKHVAGMCKRSWPIDGVNLGEWK